MHKSQITRRQPACYDETVILNLYLAICLILRKSYYIISHI